MRRIELYKKINQLVHKTGFDIRRFPLRDQRILIKYLEKNGVKSCFDVGANTGQFASNFIASGFTGKVFSFEPQKQAFEQLKKKADKKPNWTAYNIGLGNFDGTAKINISENSVSSSILDINQTLLNAAPGTKYIDTEDITVNRLDTFIKNNGFDERFFLKIDAQGFEYNILQGATDCFSNIYALQLELACTTLYSEQKLFDEMKSLIEAKGFHLSSLESGTIDYETGQLLEAEAVFIRILNT